MAGNWQTRMENKKDITILAIESSCDETAAAVVRNGREVLSNVISSQIALHTLYGGVVPEIASRKHIEKINQVVEEALKQALIEYKGSILLICHEPEFYRDVVSQVWDCSKWTTKVL